MRVTVPDYYDQFQCLAGSCPHSCCEKWEVVIDDESVCLYESISGPLGEKLREAMTEDEDGDICFPLNGGRCPFLDEDNLCEIHKQLGEPATSETCREHPRFTEDYGSFREITLSASCPAANDLLLGSEEPLRFVETETAEPEEEEDSWLEYLLPLRNHMMKILTDRTMPLYPRLHEFLLLASEAQWRLDEDRIETLPNLAEEWQGEEVSVDGGSRLFPAALRALASLEILESDWTDLLREAETVQLVAQNEKLLERIAVYFAFRYLLKCVNDGDLLSRAQLCVLAVLVIERLAAVCGLGEALRRFSCEIEHSEGNLEVLQAALFQDSDLSLTQFLAYLKE